MLKFTNMRKGLIKTLFIIVIFSGLLIRGIFIPFSSGSDIPQFFGFTTTFIKYTMDFYLYADGSLWIYDGWPYPWPYVYPPLPILLFTTLRVLSYGPRTNISYIILNETTIIHSGYVTVFLKDSIVLGVWVSKLWIIITKSLFVLGDVFVAILIFYLLNKNIKGVVGSALYFLNPMVIYISSIYGMFDQIALMFFIASLYFLFLRKKEKIAGFLMGLSIMTKQTLIYPLIVLIVKLKKRYKKFIIFLMIAVLMIMIPFISSYDNMLSVFRLLLLSSNPTITEPLFYSFNGISSLFTWLYVNNPNEEFLVPIKYWFIPFTITYLLVLTFSFKNKLNYFESAYLGYMAWTATYWRVNHQYLVPLIAFSVINTFNNRTQDKIVKSLSIFLILFVGLWVIIFPTSWWFRVHIPPQEINHTLINLLEKYLSLMIYSNEVYVTYSLLLTIIQYAIIYCVLLQKCKKYGAAGGI